MSRSSSASTDSGSEELSCTSMARSCEASKLCIQSLTHKDKRSEQVGYEKEKYDENLSAYRFSVHSH